MSDERPRSIEALREAQAVHPDPQLSQTPAAPGPTGYRPGRDDDEEEGSGGVDIRRYLSAVLRRAWLLVIGLGLGGGAGYVVWQSAELEYVAEGSIWIGGNGGGLGDLAPIQLGGLFSDNAWVELLRSYSVMDPVALQERLYLDVPDDAVEVFETFELAEQFAPGRYSLTKTEDGELVLRSSEDLVIDRAQPGSLLGIDVGFEWIPNASDVGTDAPIEFQILAPREAARDLMTRLGSRIDNRGNFIRLSLRDTDPERVASVLAAVMERHVAVADTLKRGRLQESTVILEEQLIRAERELAQAEAELENFRIETITLPSDMSSPIAGGLQQTTNAVFSQFFQMQVNYETLRRDRQQLGAAFDSIQAGQVRVEALEAIPAVARSSEMQVVLNDLVQARAGLRVLRDRYNDNYPPIQEALAQIENIESEAIPRLVRGVLQQLAVEEAQTGELVDSASQELAKIPPRTIEEARLRRRVNVQESLYNDLVIRVETARLASASSIPDVRILDQVAVPQFPTGDSRLTTALMMVMAGLGGAIALAILLDQMDPRFRYPNEVGRNIGLDILGSIPRIANVDAIADDENAHQVVEAFRELRMTTGFAYGSAGPLLLTISSPSESEGKSLISANLAVAFAEVNHRTLLIDGDTRRGDVHRLLGVQRVPGLSDYLKDRSNGDIIQATEYERLDFIGSGTRSHSTPEMLASGRMASFLGTLKRAYDVIIIDSPPLAAGADPFVLGALTGNMAVVIRTGSTEKALTKTKLEAMSRFPVRLLGAILNDIDLKGSSGYYYTSYLAGYEAIEEEASEPPLLTGAVKGS